MLFIRSYWKAHRVADVKVVLRERYFYVVVVKYIVDNLVGSTHKCHLVLNKHPYHNHKVHAAVAKFGKRYTHLGRTYGCV